jgi:hypothetical protein
VATQPGGQLGVGGGVRGDLDHGAVLRLRFGGVAAARIVLSFGGDVEVVSPPEVREDLAVVAAATVRVYDVDRTRV